MDGQKLKELLRSETQFAMCGKNARSLSKEKGNAAIQIKCLHGWTENQSGNVTRHAGILDRFAVSRSATPG
jgi:hypothetical protein